MSDVHGRKRERTTEELIKARREREAVKIKEYNQLVEQCRQKMDSKDYSEETFNLTTRIVEWNPDFYTIWNYRRIVLLNSILKDLSEEEKQKVYMKELMLFLQLIRKNPKSYWMWNHRIWCLQNMPNPDWHAELGLVEKMLTMDARNFHGWDYRRFVVGHLRKNATSPEELAAIVEGEYNFTTQKINQSFSNYSAWHQRSKLLPEIVQSMTAEEKNKVALNELDLVKNAIYTDPEDQSAWLYYWWLLGRAPENVSLLGAYRLEQDPSVIVLGFNDCIKLTQKPQLFDKDDKEMEFQMYPLDTVEGESASVWIIIAPSENAKWVFVNSNAMLPSTSAKTIPHDKSWKLEIKHLSRGPGALENISSLKNKIESNQLSEWKPISTKMYNDPTLKDQSAWFTLDKLKLLQDEIETVRELLEIEPDSAWALQTLVHFLSQLILRADMKDEADGVYNEIVSLLDKLVDLDSDRRMRYITQKNQILFKQLTRSLVLNNEEYNESPEATLDLSRLDTISLPSALLLLSNIRVSSEKVQKLLMQSLPFLEECSTL